METAAPQALKDFFRRHNQACIEHRFADLGAFVGEEVRVNGRRQDLSGGETEYVGSTMKADERVDHLDLRRKRVGSKDEAGVLAEVWVLHS
jgi:hypothetical protein